MLNVEHHSIMKFKLSITILPILLSCVLMAQESSSISDVASSHKMTVAERNAEQGFNDTIDRLADDFVLVSLVIAEPGDVLYSILGHAAIHMQCPYYNLDYVFSYESEAVRGKVLRFLMDDLKMGMTAISSDEFLEQYRQEGRGVREYHLNLPPEAETELWRVLDEKVGEGMMLKYDCIKRGCATSCRKLIEQVCKSPHIVYSDQTLHESRTMREQFYDNAPHGWPLFECMTLGGGYVDDPTLPATTRLIAPRELVAAWQHATINDTPLITGEPHELAPTIKQYRGDKFTPLHASLIILLLAIVSLFWKRPYLDWVILALQTLLGCLMLWLLFSPLPGTEWSWLIIPFNPLPAIFWKWRNRWGLFYAIGIVVWCIGMLCAPHRLVEYAHILLSISFAIVLVKSRVHHFIEVHNGQE